MTGGIVFDACAIAAVIDPTILQTKAMHIDIEINGTFTRGRTVADIHDRKKLPKNVEVGTSINREKFLDILYDSLK